jgi:hypothetical protein
VTEVWRAGSCVSMSLLRSISAGAIATSRRKRQDQCAGVGRPAVSVSVRDQTNDSPAALGATLYLFRSETGSLIESVIGDRDDLPPEAAWGDSGVFDLVIEKR